MEETIFISFKKYLKSINWTVLFFLVFVLNVKLVVKIAALLIISLINRNKLFNKQILNQGIIVFYFSMIALVVIHVLLYFSSVSFPYFIAVSISAGLWFMAAVAAYHIFIFTNEEDIKKLHNTLMLFFILHAVFILFNFLLIVIETGAINPYEFKGLNQKYYLSTGDFIRGITLDNSVTTAIISAFGMFYFLYQRNFFLSLISMICFLLMVSNLSNFAVAAIFIFLLLFKSDRIQKSMIVVYMMMMIVFMVKISPHNLEYVESWVYRLIGKAYYLPKQDNSFASLKKKPDSLLSFEDRREKSALLYIDSISSVQQIYKKPSKKLEIKQIPTVKKDSQLYVYKALPAIARTTNKYKSFIDTFYTSSQVEDINRNITDWNKPGKWIGFHQLIVFYKKHPRKLLLGNGAANFSSRVAFKATALNIAGGYPEKFRYINPDFKNNHLYVYLYYHSQKQSKHAAVNIPDSVYGQLLGEYGIAGLLCFIIIYVGYFLKRIRYLTYGLPILLLIGATFFFEYWFELLSVVILFEFMLLLNIKESASIYDRK